MVVIVYDITDEKRLRKVAKRLEQEGIRAQRSVFEVDKKLGKKIFKELKEMLEDSDKCFMFPFSKKEDIQGDTSIDRIF